VKARQTFISVLNTTAQLTCAAAAIFKIELSASFDS